MSGLIGHPEASGLIGHLETYLGKIVGGWSVDGDGKRLPFQVALFERGPVPGTRVLATLGTSNTLLKLGEKGRRVRQELVMMFREALGHRNLPGILQEVGLEALRTGRAYAAGEVIGPRGELLSGFHAEALYVAVPVYFPDEFHVFRPRTGEPIVFGWLVPITAKEASFVRNHGWAAFEKELERQDPDLLDFGRASII